MERVSKDYPDTRCRMVREFANGNVVRCAQSVWNPDNDEFCYYCNKQSLSMLNPFHPSEESDKRVVKAYHKDTGKVYYPAIRSTVRSA